MFFNIKPNMFASRLAMVLLCFQGYRTEKLDPSTACAGHELVIETVKVCDGVNSIMTQDNFTAVLMDNCTLASSGCISFKSFATWNLNYTVSFAMAAMIKSMFPDAPLDDQNIDGCGLFNMIPDAYVKNVTDLGLPAKCPVTGTTICATNGPIYVHFLNEIAKYHNIKPYLGLAVTSGFTSGRVTSVHDTGVSCVDFGGRLRNKKRVDVNKKMKSIDDFKNRMMGKPTTTTIEN